MERADTSGRKVAVAHTNSIVPGASGSPNAASATEFAADLAWERAQEQAAIAWRAGDPITPTRLWAAALDIAEKRFGRGDPRLASSLTNNALVMRRRRQDYQAKKMFHDALEAWDDSWRWIHLMTPDRAPDGARRSAGGYGLSGNRCAREAAPDRPAAPPVRPRVPGRARH